DTSYCLLGPVRRCASHLSRGGPKSPPRNLQSRPPPEGWKIGAPSFSLGARPFDLRPVEMRRHQSRAKQCRHPNLSLLALSVETVVALDLAVMNDRRVRCELIHKSEELGAPEEFLADESIHL